EEPFLVSHRKSTQTLLSSCSRHPLPDLRGPSCVPAYRRVEVVLRPRNVEFLARKIITLRHALHNQRDHSVRASLRELRRSDPNDGRSLSKLRQELLQMWCLPGTPIKLQILIIRAKAHQDHIRLE